VLVYHATALDVRGTRMSLDLFPRRPKKISRQRGNKTDAGVVSVDGDHSAGREPSVLRDVYGLSYHEITGATAAPTLIRNLVALGRRRFAS
jgi:hypothetical protein